MGSIPVSPAIKIINMKKKTIEKFIEEARKVHGNKYNYTKTEYKHTNTKVCIICPIHGNF